MITMRIKARYLEVACVASLLVLLGLAWAFPAETQVTYTGRAFGAFVNVPTLAVGPQFISDTGELPPDGTPRSAALADVVLPGVLRVQLLVANTSGANGVAESSAFLAGADVLNGLLTATAVGARSIATCNGVQGATEVLDLKLAGQTITVDPFAPNQKFGPIAVGGLTATLIINEQTQNSGPGLREITVNAVHLTVEGEVQAEVILSSARSDIHGCPGCPPMPPCRDFVTGGGWINVEYGRASFGFNAGVKGGTGLDAHVNYIDHSSGMHIKATSITDYVTTGPTSRRFKGSAEINGVPGQTYEIEVADNGEPGRSDTFSISLSNRYSAGGRLAGGNIQLHKPCP
jgi:hypothetical protein